MAVERLTRAGLSLLLLLGADVPWAAQEVMPSPRAEVPAVRLEDYRLLAVAPSERVAILRGPDKRLLTLKVGMTLEPAKARLKQVLPGRLQFEALGARGEPESVWMIAAARPELAPEVQRESLRAPLPVTAVSVPPVKSPPPTTGTAKKQ